MPKVGDRIKFIKKDGAIPFGTHGVVTLIEDGDWPYRTHVKLDPYTIESNPFGFWKRGPHENVEINVLESDIEVIHG